jgi:ribosomal protein S18 acetylase RimI-like enzyme
MWTTPPRGALAGRRGQSELGEGLPKFRASWGYGSRCAIMGQMRIEPVGPEWFEDVVGLWERAGLTRPWNDPRADLRRAVDGPASLVLIGVKGDRLIATVMVGHDGHRGWVYYLAVSPEAQREGHGRTMMSAAEAWLRARGIPKLNLMVRSGNQAVGDFYRSLGYEIDDVLVFSRRLDGGGLHGPLSPDLT